MARYIVHVRTPRSSADAFAYMADLNNFAKWDPGVEQVVQVQGDGPAPDAAFDVTVKSIGRSLTLRYHTIRYEPPTTIVARAESKLLTSLDTITVCDSGDGSVVTYDAELIFNGLLRFADPLLKLGFKRIGDRAAAGLVTALGGERVEHPNE